MTVRPPIRALAVLAATCATLLSLGCASRLPDAMNMSPGVISAITCGRHGIPVPRPVSVPDLRIPDTGAPLKSFTLEAAVAKRPGLPDMWAFNGTVPGPEIRIRQGDHVHVLLINSLPVATSIHWHGIAVPNSADGVAGVTQNAVKPGESFAYDFIATEPGTYWYHSHQDTSNQVPAGLFGALVVDPPDPPPVDRDYTLVYHDAVPPSRRFLPIATKILGSIDRGSVAVNGTRGDLVLDAAPGELVRLRIINATAGEVTAYGTPLYLVPVGAPFTVVALDGHDLHGPQEIESELLPVASGQRYDVVLRMPASGVVRVRDRDLNETVTIGERGAGGGSAGAPVNFHSLPLFDFTRYGAPVGDSSPGRPVFDVTCTLKLGNHAGFHDGKFGLVHTINGRDFPAIPMIVVRSGQVVKLHIVNGTEEYHPMHLHGHVFHVLARNGVPLQGSPVRLDTLLVAPHETWDVAFTADNPGIWMLHCHVLLHAATGMDMMVAYAGVSTPFDVGRASGNIPE